MSMDVMIGNVKIKLPDILFDETNYTPLALLLREWLIWFACMVICTTIVTVYQTFFVG